MSAEMGVALPEVAVSGPIAASDVEVGSGNHERVIRPSEGRNGETR